MQNAKTLTEMLCFSVHAADQAFAHVYRPALVEIGLTYPQFLVMTLLWERDDRTVGELGQQLHLQSNTLTPLLKRLETMDAVSRRRDMQDERSVRITLTERGRALKALAPEVHRCVGDATGLSADEMNDLSRRLTDLQMRLRGIGCD